MAKIELECKFRLCPHNEFDKCRIPGGVTIIQSGRCIHASIVLDVRKSSEQVDSPANVGGVAGEQGTANISRDEICADTIESESMCDYCQRQGGEYCGDCDEGTPGCHFSFLGRKLRPC